MSELSMTTVVYEEKKALRVKSKSRGTKTFYGSKGLGKFEHLYRAWDYWERMGLEHPEKVQAKAKASGVPDLVPDYSNALIRKEL